MRCYTAHSLYLAILAILAISVSAKSVDHDLVSNNNLAHGYLSRRAEGHGGAATNATSAAPVQVKKKKDLGPYSNPEILAGGTLFYIGVGVTVLLWTTGKIIDVKIERQERYAEKLAHSI
ncbi:hypothetical protein BD560DRAFT_403885 [Blakeslea trispora]|nr:hypothetical protein BD560DRAFT_403885 [Blakeslea trispora]